MKYTLWGHAQLRGSYMIRINVVTDDGKIFDTHMEWPKEPTQEQIDEEVAKVLSDCEKHIMNEQEELMEQGIIVSNQKIIAEQELRISQQSKILADQEVMITEKEAVLMREV